MDAFSDPITWSRNFDDEDQDDEEVVELPNVKFELTEDGKRVAVNGKLKTKLLLIGVKTAASIFLHANYETKTLLGEVLIEDVKSGVVELRQHHLNHKTNKLYSATSATEAASNAQNTLIFVSQISTPESLNRLANRLFEVVEADEIVIFDTLPATTYLAGVRHQVPATRRICTSLAHSEDKHLPPFLEAPVLIEGVTAAILQYAQIRNLKAVAYISLEDLLYLETPTIVAWEACLKHHTVHPTSSTPYSTLLKKVVSHRPNSLFA